MLTDKQLRERAEEMALAEFFCNVGEDDWPKNPWDLLNREELYSEDGDYCLLVWEPFEHMEASYIVELVDNAVESYYNHLRWARDNAA